MAKSKKKPFSLEMRDSVAVIWMDVPGQSKNTMRSEFSESFEEVMDLLEAEGAKAAVLASRKEDNFLAGADIKMLDKVNTAVEASALSRQGQEAMNRLAESSIPVVAAIHGECLGGGLELALACHERVCSDDGAATKMGLPEVKLGLLPGAGGTQRLPRLVGIQTALDMMLTGRNIRPRKAKKMGLVNEVVRKTILVDVAAERALRLANRGGHDEEGPMDRLGDALKGLASAQGAQKMALEENPLGRKLLFQQARKQTLSKTHGNYPAAERIIDVVEYGFSHGLEKGLEEEARYFGELLMTPQSKQLVNIFLASQELKKDLGVDDDSVEPAEIQKVGVLGGGLMGSGIAYVTVQNADIDVRLKDKDDDGVAHGLKSVRKLFDKRVKKKAMDKLEADRQMHRIGGTSTYDGFDACDIVIEAVFEDLDLKHRMIQDIEGLGRDDIIFASNTSSIPITRLAEGAERPENVIGLHYFSPVEKMPLLEIIVTEHTRPEVVATCVELGKQQGKTVIVVNDGVGFYTSRILGPYMNEAARILLEGVPIEIIDKALVNWGYQVGPVKLMDEVGLDVAAKVGPIMAEAYGDRLQAPGAMDQLLEDGRKGRKNGKGLYKYEDGKRKGVDESVYDLMGITPDKTDVDPVAIAERCALMMVNEAAHCLGEGILRNPRDGDIGAIFGLGFPPFRGGPFRYVDSVGADGIVRKLRRFEKEYGEHFRPAPILVEKAEAKGHFY